MNSRTNVGITIRLQNGESSMPPTITQASGCCSCDPIPGETAAGTRPMQAESPVMKIWCMQVSPAAMTALATPCP